MRYFLFLIFTLIVLFQSCKDTESKSNQHQVDAGQEVMSDTLIEVETPVFADLDFIIGKFDPSTDSSFVWVDTKYTDKPYIFLQKESYEQFLKMREKAALEGIDLKILSATRSFDYQKRIWERKWQKLKAKGMTDPKLMASEILKYSAMPGTSRHHWGTDIDLNYLSNSWFESGKGQKIYSWLLANASDFGFCQPYTTKDEMRPKGYEEEKWHWSYLPLANIYMKGAKKYLTNEKISGFSGSETAADLQVVESFIMSINPACQP